MLPSPCGHKRTSPLPTSGYEGGSAVEQQYPLQGFPTRLRLPQWARGGFWVKFKVLSTVWAYGRFISTFNHEPAQPSRGVRRTASYTANNPGAQAVVVKKRNYKRAIG